MWRSCLPYAWVVAGFGALALLGSGLGKSAVNFVALVLLAAVVGSAVYMLVVSKAPLMRKQALVTIVFGGLVFLWSWTAMFR